MKNIDFEKLEILSPAGSAECFYANINAGCDAVYLGLSDFNARMKAQNFTTENIREFVKFAHKFSVKVYVTVNTLINNEQFDDFLNMIKILTNSKVDAFIVQDFGIAHLLKSSFKGITLHASTQMGIHNLNGAKIAEELGFSRIVLSRETSIEDIKEIKNNTNLEIEYFVQGALCVAFSGNCYFSSLEKSASGNEGKCLQLCRLPYENNIDNKTAYYLSARDLSLLHNLKELITAGVTSFKIEGRMRHAGYTATATKIYRQALDLLKLNQLSSNNLKSFEDELKISYSRGNYNQNAYLFETKNEPIINPDYQNHIGTKIGFVKQVEPFKNGLIKATLSLNEEIFEGDGLKFINPKTKTQVASLGVGNVDKTKNGDFVIYTKSKFSANLDVHLTQSSKNEQKILKNIKKIKLNVKINAFNEKPLEVIATSNTASVRFKSDYLLEKATKIPISKNDFKNQFEKLSETCFELNLFDFEGDGIFLPKSKINDARRTMIELLENEIIFQNEKHLNVSFNEKSFEDLSNKSIISTPTNIVVFHTLSQIKNIDTNTIYVYDPNNYSKQDILNTESQFNSNFALNVPTILKHEDKLYFEDIVNSLKKTTSLYANNIGALAYKNMGFNIITSPLLNIKNNYALKCLNTLKISTIVASIESDLNFVESNNLIKFSEGEFPLMTFAHCPYKVVTKTTCNNCKYNEKLTYKNPNLASYKIHRTKLKNCQFQLTKELNHKNLKFFVKNLNY